MIAPGKESSPCPRCGFMAAWGQISDENGVLMEASVLYCENCDAMVKVRDVHNNPFMDERTI